MFLRRLMLLLLIMMLATFIGSTPAASAEEKVRLVGPGVIYAKDVWVPPGVVLRGRDGTIFDGSRRLSGWQSVAGLRCAPYRPIPNQDGHGIRFTRGQNVSRFAGRYPDQAWANDRTLRQVTARADVMRGTFWVGDGVLCVTDEAGIRVSSARAWGTVAGRVENVTIRRYSANAKDGAVVRLVGSGDLSRVWVISSAMVAVQAVGRGNTLDRVTISRSGWMGVSATKCRDLTMRDVVIRNVNRHREYATVPQSGALKTSRCRGVSITGSRISKVVGHGLWFDQSTTDTRIASTTVDRVNGRALFYEISHGLRTDNSSFASSESSKFAGASGVRLGPGSKFDPGYNILRERRNCPNPATPLCPGALASDRAWPYDPRITWRNDVKRVP